MFDDFLRNCDMADEIKPSKKRVKKNIAALELLIETEENTMAKRKFKLKPWIAAAVITVISAVSLLTVVNAANHGSIVKFIMGGKEIEGEYYDYVDGDGFRRVSFGAVLPVDEENFAVLYDVDAPQGENVRVITEETDADFMNRLRLYMEADREACYKNEQTEQFEDGTLTVSECVEYPEPEDFGLVFKDSELCLHKFDFVTEEGITCCGEGTLGGEFMHTGAAAGKPSGSGSDEAPNQCTYDWDNGIKIFKHSFYYYVGEE